MVNDKSSKAGFWGWLSRTKNLFWLAMLIVGIGGYLSKIRWSDVMQAWVDLVKVLSAVVITICAIILWWKERKAQHKAEMATSSKNRLAGEIRGISRAIGLSKRGHYIIAEHQGMIEVNDKASILELLRECNDDSLAIPGETPKVDW